MWLRLNRPMRSRTKIHEAPPRLRTVEDLEVASKGPPTEIWSTGSRLTVRRGVLFAKLLAGGAWLFSIGSAFVADREVVPLGLHVNPVVVAAAPVSWDALGGDVP